uniref:T4 RNA ligase 1-like N-terminal domain-containing protein n=1 Tax=viral metagenome TaxID=1070528 RepID=A0A6C0CRI5_9ZZZZ
MATATSPCRYDLNTVNGKSLTSLYNFSKQTDEVDEKEVDALLNSNRLRKKQWFYKDNTYTIVRYDKQMLSHDLRQTSGLFRSVIINNGNVVCFAPPKSEIYEKFVNESVNQEIIAEEFVEGTMINMFWTGSEWEIATRSSVGGKVAFFTNENSLKNKNESTFRWMFLDAVSHWETLGDDVDFFKSFENIPKNQCLSFVLQHPKNRIVVPFSEPNIYLVSAYNIEGNIVTELNDQEMSNLRDVLPDFIKAPEKVLSFDSVDELRGRFTNSELDYKTVGVMIKSNGVRTKVRNPNYENVRLLRGNQPKLQYRYLMLRSNQKVSEYLKYYPEHSKLFSKYRNMIHTFTKRLHDNYISCYVKKQAPLHTYSSEYRTNMFKLHEKYVNELMSNGDVVTRSVVIDYVNHLPLQILMHAVNYQYYNMNKDEKKMKLESVSQDDESSQMDLDN